MRPERQRDRADGADRAGAHRPVRWLPGRHLRPARPDRADLRPVRPAPAGHVSDRREPPGDPYESVHPGDSRAGATIPIVTGRFDLSIGYGIGLAHVVAMWLIVSHGLAWPLAALIVLAGGVVVGLLNGALVEFAQIDSFIATLGTGSVLYALT